MTDARKSRILIADDEPFNCELLEAFLSEGNYELEYAADGQETLDKTASFKPDLILLDVMMPKLSGFEVCEKLKKESETASVMILMVTALNDLGDVERAVAVGCDDFLSKPINQLELLIRVENLLKLRSVTSELERLRQYVDSMEEAFAPKKKA
ncbi:MAG: two-component system response regulator [Thermoguttaceae bacterium]